MERLTEVPCAWPKVQLDYGYFKVVQLPESLLNNAV